MIKKIFVVFFVSFCGLFAYAYFSKKPMSEPRQHPFSVLLDQELERLCPDPNPYHLSKLWQSTIENGGLTYSIDATAVLRNEKFLEKDKAEERYAEVYAEYQKKVNSIPQIRPFLDEFPVTPKSFFLSARFKTIEGSFFNAPYLAVIGPFLNDTIRFLIYSPETMEAKHDLLKTIALKRTEDSEFLKPCYKPFVERIVGNAEEIKIPPVQLNPSSPPSFFSVLSFAEKFSSERHLFPLALGSAGKRTKNHSPFSFALWGQEQLLFEVAHKMAVECARDFLKFLQKDKAALNQMKEESKEGLYNDPATIPEPRHMTFRISLWDKSINRQPAPYIAEIRLQDGVFEYFTSDEGQNLVSLYSETFEDAMHFLETSVSKEPSEESNSLPPPSEEKSTRPQEILTIRLDKELESFHSSANHAHPVRMWMPEMSLSGFTQSFEPFEILMSGKQESNWLI